VKRLPKRIAYAVVALALLGLLAWAFVPKPVPVDVATVKRGAMRVTVDEEGKTRIAERHVIAAPIEGQLQRVLLDPGDPVEAGRTVLAVIEPRDPALLDPRARAEAEARVDAAGARLEQTEPALVIAQLEYESAQREYRRLTEAGPGAASARQIDDALVLAQTRAEAVRSARIARDVSASELEAARTTLRRTFPATAPSRVKLTAPISGTVLRVLRESSMPVLPGAEIIEVGDPHDLEVEMEVLSSEAVKVEPGDRILFVRWGGSEELNGVVRRVEPQAFTKISALGVEEQRVKVIADFTDPSQRFQSLGDAFRLDAQIIIWEDPDTLILPTSALFRRGEQWQVFAAVDGRAVLRNVSVGQMNGLLAQVIDGLAAGDVVIVHPSDQVTAGARIEPRASDPK
jgi:HlyD family secretion protein